MVIRVQRSIAYKPARRILHNEVQSFVGGPPTRMIWSLYICRLLEVQYITHSLARYAHGLET